MPDMPEWSKHPRHRRNRSAPYVSLELWVEIMSRRIELQLKRDWLFGYTMGNVLFKSLVNRCKTVYSYQSVMREDGSTGFSAAELETGVISICKALSGTYRDLDGKRKQVQGDINTQ